MPKKRTAQEMEDGGSTAPLEKIGKNGDVIFEIGEANPKRRILVSSAILNMASTAFAALLGPHFREGQELANANSPVTIPLPDDEPQAMSDLFRLLHLVPVPQLGDLGRTDRMASFAIVADKYCCTEALSTQAEWMMLKALTNKHLSSSAVSLVRLAETAYLLKQNDCFSEFAKRLIFSYGESYLQLRGIAQRDILPPDFFFILEERRTFVKNDMASSLCTLGTTCRCGRELGNKLRRGFQRTISHQFFDQLDSAWLPIWSEDYETVELGAKVIRDIQPYTSSTSACLSCGQPFTVPKQSFTSLADKAENMCSGLSIKCVKDGCIEFRKSSMKCIAEGRHAA